MSRPAAPLRAPGTPRALAAGATAVVLALLVAVLTGPAHAFWSATGSGSASATTGTLSAPGEVAAATTRLDEVDLDWTAGSGGVTPEGYYVTRQSAASVTGPACSSSPTALLTTTGCTDDTAPDGDHTYVVTAVFRSWTAPSAASDIVSVVNASALAFTTQPSPVTAGAPITPPVSVALRTAAGDSFAEAGVPVTLTIETNPSDGLLAGTLTRDTDADGVASFPDLSIDQVGVGYTLSATSPGLAGATSAEFPVTAPPLLGPAGDFSVLAWTTVVSSGATTVSGDLGVSPGTAVTGFGPTEPGVVSGDIHAGDAAAADAQTALARAYDELAALPADVEIVGDLGGRTLTPGVYHSTAALALTGTLILDAGGNADAVFVFQADAAFDTAAASQVTLVNGAQASNVFWVVAGAAGAGANSFLSGTILAEGAITLGAGTELIGRALSRGAVTLAANTIRFGEPLPPMIAVTGAATATTKDQTPTISGTSNAPSGSAVIVTVAGQRLSTSVGVGGTWSVTASELTAGTYTVSAQVRVSSGDAGRSSQELTVEVNPDMVPLGVASTFSVLAETSVVNTGATQLSGDLGVSSNGAVTGFGPGPLEGKLDGTIHAGDALADSAQADLGSALDEARARAPHTEITGDLGGRNFHVGVHHSTAALALTGTVTLDAEGDPNAVFIFTTDAAFNTAANARVNLINGAQADRVFWVVTGAVGTGANSYLSGAILAQGAITLGAGTVLVGQALSMDTVTLAGNTLTGITPAPDGTATP